MKIGYLGPEGSYSQLAAIKFRPAAQAVGYATFFALFSALDNGECDYIAVPIENTLQGGVLQNIDLMQNNGVFAVEERVVQIDHRLAKVAGADNEDIKKIYSHPQALAQCALFLNENFPRAELIATSSTTAGLAEIKDGTEAAIVGAHITASGFELSKENIADEKLNFTHFLLVQKGGLPQGKSSQRVFFSATCRHRPGELFRLLSILKDGGLNMTKIESRPIKGKPGEYRFFIELEGDISDERTAEVLKNLRAAANSFKLLGAY